MQIFNRRVQRRHALALLVCLALCFFQTLDRLLTVVSAEQSVDAGTEKGGNEGNHSKHISALTTYQEAEKLRAEQRRESSEEAAKKYLAAAELWHEVDRLDLAAGALRSAGEIFQVLGDPRQRMRYYNDGLRLSRKAKNRLEESKLLNAIGYAAFLDGDGETARENSIFAWNIATSLGDKSIQAQALHTLAESFFSFGELVTAQTYQQMALSLWKDLGNLSGQSQALVAMGWYRANLKEPRGALEFFEQALTAAKNGNDLRGQAVALNAIANIKAKLGYRQEALDAYANAQPLAVRTGDQICLANILGGIGTLHFQMNDPKTALQFIEPAVGIMQRINATWGIAEGKLGIGRIRHALGDHQAALINYDEALRLFRTLGMRRLESQTLREIGYVQMSIGELAQALRSYQQALKLLRKGQDQRHEAATLNHLGLVYEALKDQSQALTCYERALELSRQAADPAAESTALFNIARLERDAGKLLDAQQHLEDAIRIDESIRSQVLSQDLRASYFANVRAAYELYIDVLMLRHKTNPRDGFDAQAFAISERARGRSFLELLKEAGANVREGVDADLLSKERSVNESLNEKAEQHVQALANKNVEAAERLSKEIAALTVEYGAIRDRIRATNPKYASLTLPQPLNLQQVQQQSLQDDSILLEYALGDVRSYVWLVTRTSISSYELPSRRDIESSATRLYNLFVASQPVSGEPQEERLDRQRKAKESIPREAAVLSKLILGPLATKLGNKRLLIVADGPLQYIPFQALNDPDSPPESPQYLVKNHEIVNELSASTLAILLSEEKQRSAPSNTVAVFADPVFEVDDPRVKRSSSEPTPESEQYRKLQQALRDIGLSADGVEIPRLFSSADEAEAIIKYVPWGTGLKAVGFAASRQRATGRELANYRIVHFATHGLINNEHPDLSGIVLSLFDQQGHSQDGFLRLHDIYNLHLPADLVVLSACSTGLGKDVKGEGLISLTRGFMYAGASSVVASLWKVDDEATAELMKYFYSAMFKKRLTPAAALRDAQLQMSQQARWQSPYYWAGFVIQGEYNKETVVPGFLSFLGQPYTLTALIGSILFVAVIVLLSRRRDSII